MPTTSSRPWLATQPLKALAIIGFLLALPPYIVGLFVKYTFSSLRPSPKLSRSANMELTKIRGLVQLSTRTHSAGLASEKPPSGKNRTVAVKVPPEQPPLFTGVLTPTADGNIKPVARTAIWFPEAPPSKTKAKANEVGSETVVLYFPGGAFVIKIGHEKIGSKAAQAMLENTGATRFVWAQYRLANSAGGNCFPAAIQDALTFYAYVLSLGYEPGKVIVSGDSAGGNVAIGLLRYLETSRVLPLPGGVMAWSPWVDVTAHAGRVYDECSEVAAATDILSREFLQWGANAYRATAAAGTVEEEEVEAFVSPLHHPFKTSVPLFVHAGEDEVFYQSVKKFAEEMEAVNDKDRIRFHGTPKAVHDLILFWEAMEFRKEIDAAVRDGWSLMMG